MSRTIRNEHAAHAYMTRHAEQAHREARALKSFSAPAPQRTRTSTVRRIARAFGI